MRSNQRYLKGIILIPQYGIHQKKLLNLYVFSMVVGIGSHNFKLYMPKYQLNLPNIIWNVTQQSIRPMVSSLKKPDSSHFMVKEHWIIIKQKLTIRQTGRERKNTRYSTGNNTRYGKGWTFKNQCILTLFNPMHK